MRRSDLLIAAYCSLRGACALGGSCTRTRRAASWTSRPWTARGISRQRLPQIRTRLPSASARSPPPPPSPWPRNPADHAVRGGVCSHSLPCCRVSEELCRPCAGAIHHSGPPAAGGLGGARACRGAFRGRQPEEEGAEALGEGSGAPADRPSPAVPVVLEVLSECNKLLSGSKKRLQMRRTGWRAPEGLSTMGCEGFGGRCAPRGCLGL